MAGMGDGMTAPKPGVTGGRCSACLGLAERMPSGRWWHLDRPCPNRGQLLFRVAVTDPDGCMRITSDSERPARFIPDDTEVTV
jgi:hypothetical protein